MQRKRKTIELGKTRDLFKKIRDTKVTFHAKTDTIKDRNGRNLVKAMILPVVMYRCESWTIKKVESLRIGAFELQCWRRHLRVPWTARRSN